ncbi:MAG: DUF4197 domain-containing protein, partial [Flavobacteriales bacterium]|nr:DUF4197 domain-containing protein [Flavobacteriales bacterium]
SLPSTLPSSEAPLSQAEVSQGLKEALIQGVRQSVSLASVEDGFYGNQALFIPFPEEASKVKETALKFGLETQVANFERTLNRAAEEASKSATTIFVDAVKNMSIEDAFAILQGGETAASDFLMQKTRTQLETAFAPKVQEAIEKVELTKYWEPLISKYNIATQFTGGEPVNEDLEAYVTDRAIDGLFVHIKQEEQKIRSNPAARVTELLKRVFGSVD